MDPEDRVEICWGSLLVHDGVSCQLVDRVATPTAQAVRQPWRKLRTWVTEQAQKNVNTTPSWPVELCCMRKEPWRRKPNRI